MSLSVLAYASCLSEQNFENLDYGLYWYGSGGNCQKAETGLQNAYYNSTQPTVILFHGWQLGNVVNNEYTTFNASDSDGPNIDTASFWREKGWNVGIVYWTQLADELEVKDAEAKIWTANGSKGMRWLSSDGKYRDSGLNEGLIDVFAKELIDKLDDFSGEQLRITGHSLGSQLALGVSLRLHESLIPSELQPQRVALLDPFSSNDPKSYLNGDWVGEEMRDILAELSDRGVAVEAYRSSAVASTLIIGDANNELLNATAFTELRPWYFNSVQIAQKHSAAIWHYFWSFDFNPPSVFWSSSSALSASSSNSVIKSYMTSSRKFQHLTGVYSETPSDDVMRSIRK